MAPHIIYAMLKTSPFLRWVVPLGLNSVTNTAEYGERTCLPVLSFLSLMSIYIFFYITMAQTVEKNAGLVHAWQKMMCLFTERRGIAIDAKPRSRWIPACVYMHVSPRATFYITSVGPESSIWQLLDIQRYCAVISKNMSTWGGKLQLLNEFSNVTSHWNERCAGSRVNIC